MHCYIKNGTPFANDVDVTRLSRAIKNASGSEGSLDQFQEIVAIGLGFKSYYHLQTAASDPDVSGKTGHELIEFFRKNLLTKGKKFPSILPAKFDKAWQKKSVKLITNALSKCSNDAFEFVALVGSSGSGKTLLAQNLCFMRNGRMIDIGNVLTPALNMIDGAQESSLLVLDQSVGPLTASPEIPRNSSYFFHAIQTWDNLKIDKKKWSHFIELTRKRELEIPENPVLMMGYLPILRRFLQSNRDMRIVICFASVNEARDALHMAYANRVYSREQHLANNWNRAYVVNLDTMNEEIIDHLPQEPIPEPTEEEKLRTANWIEIGYSRGLY